MTNEEYEGYRSRNKLISREEQERQGHQLKKYDRFVAPDSSRGDIKPLPAHNVTLAVNHSATQEVISTTSDTDQARGFQIRITPISIVLGLFAVLVSLAFDNEFLSFWSLIIFFGVYATVYLVALVLSALKSAEYVSWYGAKRQWDIIEREQVERWDHYKWQSGRSKPVSEHLAGNSSLLHEAFPYFCMSGFFGLLLALAYLFWG